MLSVILVGVVSESATAAQPADHVVLLHGLARSSRSMRTLEARLTAEGYRVHNLDYPSRSAAADELIGLLARRVAECCSDGRSVHFVGHSLGAILARAYLATESPVAVGRVVQLAPPNGGSEIVDRWGDQWWFRSFFGPTGARLGTGADALPAALPRPDYELGVVAATRSINPLGSYLLPGDDDGAVTVARTHVDGEADFIAVAATHTFVMRHADAVDATVRFLRSGRFTE